MPDAPLDFGITAGARPWLSDLEPQIARLGYAALWANDNPGRSGLATLAAAGAAAPTLELGLGVAPLSERTPQEIAAEVRSLGLDPERLILGIGSGSSASLELVRAGVTALRRELPSVRLAVSALGPRMCRLAGSLADVVLLNWAAPARIAWARGRIEEGAQSAGRTDPVVAAYVRVSVGPGAQERLAAERARYAGRTPRPYARQFAAQPDDPTPGVAAGEAARIPAQLAPYRAVLDRCVVRGLPERDDLEGWLAVARAAAVPAT